LKAFRQRQQWSVKSPHKAVRSGCLLMALGRPFQFADFDVGF
jgi:hypothetical protein